MSRKKSAALCKTPRCMKKRAEHSKHCHACNKRSYRRRNAMRDSYQHRKDNAKRRGKPFTITFEEFEAFAYETELLTKRGRSKFSYSVDCIIEELGYVPGNLQRLTISENSKKENARRRVRKVLMYDYRSGEARVLSMYAPGMTGSELPF